MQISIPLDNWDATRGGTERYVARISRALEARGHAVTVICMRSTPPLRGGDDTPRVQQVRGVRGPRWLRELRFAQESVAAHRASGRDVLLAVRHAYRADVYHPHGGSFRAGRAAAALSYPAPWRWARSALAACRPTIHVLRWLDRAVFERSDGLLTLAVSQKVEDDFRRTYPDLQFSFVRLENTVDTASLPTLDHSRARADWAARTTRDASAPLACFVAHNFRLKGLAHAIGAISGTKRWHLAVVGGGAPAKYARQARRLRVAPRVHFLGPLEDPETLYAACDAVLAPTYYDTCALNVLEGLAHGTPVVTTRQNGADSIVLSHEAGIVVDGPGDESGLSRALETIEGAPVKYREGALRARESFSWQEHVDTLEKTLQRAHQGSRQRAATRRGTDEK